MGKSGALLLALPHDLHILGALDGCPVGLVEIVRRAREDDVHRLDERVLRRGQLHGRDFCRGLGEEDGVAGDAFLLDIGSALAETNLLPTASANGRQHLSSLRSGADVHRLPANPVVVDEGV